jgi:hypothetical protein
MCLGLSVNRQSVFDSLSQTLHRSGDVEQVQPDEYTGQFNLIESLHTSTTSALPATTTAIVETETIQTTTTSSQQSNTTSLFTVHIQTLTSSTVNMTRLPMIDNLYHKEQITRVNIIRPMSMPSKSFIHQWFEIQSKRFGTRSLIISSLIASCFLCFLLFIILRLHCTNRSSQQARLTAKYPPSNGTNYSQLQPLSKRYSLVPCDEHRSKKRVPKFLRHLHANDEQANSVRLSNHLTDSYQLISSLQDHRSLPYRNSDCVLNEHCCMHTSLSHPSTSSTTAYHQVNRSILSGSDPPLPLPNLCVQSQTSALASSQRSLKKEVDNSSVQAYSAVYSCELAANLDIDGESTQKRLSMKRRSILKNTNSSVLQTKTLFLYVKTLVDCYALQPMMCPQNQPILLAIADENRIQLFHALVSRKQTLTNETNTCENKLVCGFSLDIHLSLSLSMNTIVCYVSCSSWFF